MNSDSLFPTMVTQTLQVTLLAAIVLGLTKFIAKDRPHLAHALWALVLLKCLTPPIFSSPTSIFSWMSGGYAAVANPVRLTSTEVEQPNVSDQPVDGLAPVIVRLSPGNSFVSNTAVSVAASQHGGRSLVSIAIFVWFSLAASVLAMNVIRLWIFLKRVSKTTLPTLPNLTRLVKNISKRIGLRRKVRIRTVDAPIGPAVVGLIWPTVLLPRAIVEGRSDAELEPLLAHELIHIRRGDLVWAMLQALSVSLWWFHPLIWLADRLLTREAERSCDEETIAGLGCSPAMYARSLLDVLERKHQLRAAPSLPGVRPVDITAKRLERIMRLGHGCYRQRPWWVVGVWVIGCAIVLPGAAWVVAQEKAKQENSGFKGVLPEGENQPQPSRIADALASGPEVATIQIESKSFQVGDVVERLCNDRILSKVQAEKELIQILKPSAKQFLTDIEGKVAGYDGEISNLPATTTESSQEMEPSLEECIAIALKNSKIVRLSGTTISIFEGQLHASATAARLKEIERKLEHFRKFGFKSLTTEILFYEVPEQLTFDEGVLQNLFSRGVEVTRGPKTGLSLSTFDKLAVFDEADTTKLKQFLEHDKNATCTHSPQVTSFNGQLASVETGETREFTVAYKKVQASDGRSDYEPVVEKMRFGLKYEFRAVIAGLPTKGDQQPIELNFKFERSNLKSVHRSKQQLSDTGKEAEIELPVKACRTFETVSSLAPNQSLVNVQTYESKTCIMIVRCRPTDTIVAAVPPANQSKIPKTAYVCISDELQSELEAALLKHRLQQLGINDFCIEDGRMKVSVTEDWRAAVDAFQKLRSKRETTATVSEQTIQNEPKFNDGNTDYYPIPVQGPFIERKWVERKVPVLGQVPYISQLFKNRQLVETKQSLPTDDEIMLALGRQSKKGLTPDTLDPKQVKIRTLKIKDFSDPARFVPLLGDTILHHVHYRCSLHDVKTDEHRDVVYIDYYQYELADELEN